MTCLSDNDANPIFRSFVSDRVGIETLKDEYERCG